MPTTKAETFSWMKRPEPKRLFPDLPPVDLDAVMLQAEASGRPLHRQATIRRAFGLPATNPALERKLKGLGLWPEEAKPLDFDISDAVWMLPKAERRTVYGLLCGLSVKEIGAQTEGWGANTGYGHMKQSQARWLLLADALGVYQLSAEPNEHLDLQEVGRVLGYRGNQHQLVKQIEKAGFTRWGRVHRRDFRTIWEAAARFEDLPAIWEPRLSGPVTMETHERYFLGVTSRFDEPMQPEGNWLTTEEAAALLGIDPNKLHLLQSRHKITAHLVPDLLGPRFRPEEIDHLKGLLDCTPWGKLIA